ncbi:MAG: hypothetical protein HGA87_06030 [Desulfobulbaceae bacterium]|nr:hypothetical protein [Desulfobulbaceae bacterium]
MRFPFSLKQLRTVCLCLIWLLTTTTALPAENRNELVDVYIRAAGGEEAIIRLGSLFEGLPVSSVIDQAPPDSLIGRVRKAMRASYDTGRAMTIFRNALSGSFSEQSLKEAISWHRSLTGRKVFRANMEQENGALPGYLAEATQKPGYDQRYEELKRLDSVMDYSGELTTRLSRAVVFSIEAARLLQGMNADGTALDQGEKFWIQIGVGMQISGAVKQMMLFRLRNLSNRELKKYIAYYETKAGQEELSVIRNAWEAVMDDWEQNGMNMLFPAGKGSADFRGT